MAISLPARAHLSIHFAVVGASIAGLASALALARAGHRVTVLEQAAEDEPRPTGGLRVPPNVSKVFARWGLAAELAAIAAESHMMRMYTYAEGELLGFSTWDAALLRECGGDCLIASYAGVCALLLAAARENGATVRFGARVEAVDEEEARVTLVGGEIIEADIVVGADGVKGLMRKAVLEEEDEDEEDEPTGSVLFNLAIPLEHIESDPAMEELLTDNRVSLWMGDGYSANGYPVRASGIYAMHIYAPAHVAPGAPDCWGAPAVSPALLLSGLGPTAEPRLHTLASLATPSSISAVRFPSLMLAGGDDDDEWMLPCAPGVILGDAAHPPVPASLQAPAMALEDAAVLAKLFSHLRRREQIPSLLGALATLRAERTRQVLTGDAATLVFSALPYGADGVAEARDASMRALTKAGRQAVGDDEADADSNEQWAHIITTWAYDAEDDADDWWASWGVIGERAQDAPTALAFDFGAGIVGVTAEEESASEDD